MKQDLSVQTTRISGDKAFIKKFIKGLDGGRTLDFEGFAEDKISAGHVIKVKDGVYSPLAVSGGSYVALGSDEAYAGLAIDSVLKAKPACAILTWGIVNEGAMPYALPTAFKTAMPHIASEPDIEA